MENALIVCHSAPNSCWLLSEFAILKVQSHTSTLPSLSVARDVFILAVWMHSCLYLLDVSDHSLFLQPPLEPGVVAVISPSAHNTVHIITGYRG